MSVPQERAQALVLVGALLLEAPALALLQPREQPCKLAALALAPDGEAAQRAGQVLKRDRHPAVDALADSGGAAIGVSEAALVQYGAMTVGLMSLP